MDLSRIPIASTVVLLVVVCLLAPVLDAAEKSKAGGLKEVGQDLEKLGRRIGAAGREAGLEIAGAAKHVFYKGKKVSAPLLRDVQRSTREFWGEVIEGKDRTIEELRRENRKLKRELGDEE